MDYQPIDQPLQLLHDLPAETFHNEQHADTFLWLAWTSFSTRRAHELRKDLEAAVHSAFTGCLVSAISRSPFSLRHIYEMHEIPRGRKYLA